MDAVLMSYIKKQIAAIEPTDLTEINSQLASLVSLANRLLAMGFTLSFDANGGTGEMESAVYLQYEEFSLPENGFTPPAGKVFLGWDQSSTSAEPLPPGPSGQTVNTSMMGTTQLLYAIWGDE